MDQIKRLHELQQKSYLTKEEFEELKNNTYIEKFELRDECDNSYIYTFYTDIMLYISVILVERNLIKK